MYFQALEYKGRNFLKLNDNNYQPICPTYSKGSAWLKYFSLSNSMYTCTTRLITNHISTGEYILVNCVCYKKSWNPRRKSLKNILTFLEFNSEAFCF